MPVTLKAENKKCATLNVPYSKKGSTDLLIYAKHKQKKFWPFVRIDCNLCNLIAKGKGVDTILHSAFAAVDDRREV